MKPTSFTTEQFVKAFTAELVLKGVQAIPPRKTDYRKTLKLVVEKIDGNADTMLDSGRSIIEARPWIDVGKAGQYAVRAPAEWYAHDRARCDDSWRGDHLPSDSIIS